MSNITPAELVHQAVRKLNAARREHERLSKQGYCDVPHHVPTRKRAEIVSRRARRYEVRVSSFDGFSGYEAACRREARYVERIISRYECPKRFRAALAKADRALDAALIESEAAWREVDRMFLVEPIVPPLLVGLR